MVACQAWEAGAGVAQAMAVSLAGLGWGQPALCPLTRQEKGDLELVSTAKLLFAALQEAF